MNPLQKESGIYSKAEANICLTCKRKRCIGECDRLSDEKRKLKDTSKKGGD